MTNNDIKQDLSLVHESLMSLKTLSLLDMPAVELNSFIDLLEQRFDDLQSHLISTLDTYELAEIAKTEGKDAALALIVSQSEASSVN